MTPSVFDPGLEYVTVAETQLSEVRGAEGELLIAGVPVEDLAAEASYEEALFLLFEDRLPTESERDAFRSSLAEKRAVGDEVADLLRRAAEDGRPPMDALRVGLSAVRVPDDADARAHAERIVAVVPTMVATYWRYREGHSPVEPRADLGRAANFHWMLTGVEPPGPAVEGLERFLVAAVDHGLNPSTFTARVVTSTESDLVSAATAAVGAVKGRRHGGNFDAVYEMLREAGEAGDVRDYLRGRRDAGGLPGFGHRIYEVRDPRARVLSTAAESVAGDDDLFTTVRRVEEAGADVLAADGSGDVEMTLECYAAALLHAVEVPPPLFAPTFAAARVGGWMAHCLEQRADNRLVRPVARYAGATDREYVPVEERESPEGSLVDGPPRTAALEPVSETLATLSEPSRLEIMVALYDGVEPMAYSTLREATSIDDKGRFNYHLRQLREYFVADHDEGYVLTAAGRAFVDAVLADDELLETLID